MAELFDKDVRTVSEHIGNLYAEGELEREATIRKFRIVRQEGKRQVRRDIDHYNLDVIISVGYRVKSQRGVQFRQWATRVLKEHQVQRYGEQDLDEVNINQWHAGRWITNRRLLLRFNRRMTVLLFSVAAVILHDHVHLPIVMDMAH